MLFDELSFHDAKLLEVKEDTSNSTIDFLLNFPVDWANNVFDPRILRFRHASFYLKKEIPFAGSPCIMEVRQLQSPKHTYNLYPHRVWSSKYKVEILTNAGSRFVEFDEVELLEVQNQNGF